MVDWGCTARLGVGVWGLGADLRLGGRKRKAGCSPRAEVVVGLAGGPQPPAPGRRQRAPLHVARDSSPPPARPQPWRSHPFPFAAGAAYTGGTEQVANGLRHLVVRSWLAAFPGLQRGNLSEPISSSTPRGMAQTAILALPPAPSLGSHNHGSHPRNILFLFILTTPPPKKTP